MTITIVDDHPLVRNFLKCYLSNHFPDDNVAVLHTINLTVVEDIIATKPNVVVLDVSLDKIDSLDFFEELKKKLPQTTFIIYTMHKIQSYINFFKNHGAHAYIAKEDSTEEMADIIKRALQNQTTFPDDSVSIDQDYRLNQLSFTPIEKEMLQALKQKINNDQIAIKLNVDKIEVLNLRKKLLFKTGAESSNHLLQLAEEYNW
jgi:DNA-binding NarL/FixJ family response regulator